MAEFSEHLRTPFKAWRQARIEPLKVLLLLTGLLAVVTGCKSGRTTSSMQSSTSSSVAVSPGPRLRPLTNRKFERTPKRLARGRYLVNGIGECFACHGPSDPKRPGWPPIPGKEGSGEAGRYVAANLTPDRETGTGDWSDDMLARGIREGVGHDGRLLDPTVMPYEFYRAMSDEDLASIIVYLRSIPAIRNPLPEPKTTNHVVAPFAIPIDAPVPMPDLSTPVKRGAYLVQLGACQWCHTLRDQQTRHSLPALSLQAEI